MMRRMMDAAGRHGWPLMVAVVLVGLVSSLVAGPEGGTSWVAQTLFVLVAVGLVFVLVVNLSGRDPDVEARALEIAPDRLSAALFARWMKRSKHFRFVGGLAGAILGFAFADGTLMPVLAGLIGGIAFGGAVAEVHSVGRRQSSPRSADITARRLGDYVSRTDSLALAAIAVVVIGMIGTAVARESDESAVLWPSLVALATVVGVVGMQWLVVVRRRPALPGDLRRADDLMRRLAATQGFTRPGIAFALVMVSQGLLTFGSSSAVTVSVIVLWMLAIGWYVSSRQSRNNLRALVAS